MLGLAVSFLIRFLHLGARFQSRADRFRSVNVALQKLAHDVQQTRAEGISLRPADPFVVGLNPIDKVQDDGLILWRADYVVYYLDSEQRLIRRTWPPGQPALTPTEQDPSKAKILLPDRLAAVVAETPVEREILALDVREFTLDPNRRDGGLVLPLRARLRVGPADQPREQCFAHRTVMTR